MWLAYIQKLLKPFGSVNQNVEHNSPLNCFLVPSFHPFLNSFFWSEFRGQPCVPIKECGRDGRRCANYVIMEIYS